MRIGKLESKRGMAGRILFAWVWGKSDAEVEHTIADLHPGPDDIVLPMTWQRSEAAGEPAPITLEDLNIGERDRLREAIAEELAARVAGGTAGQ